MHRILQRRFRKPAAIALLSLLVSFILTSCSQQVSNKPLALGTPVSQCTFPSSRAVARLYVDEGSLSISTIDHTVTYQDGSGPEVIIFYSVSSPIIRSLRCTNDSLVLVRDADNASAMELALSWIKTDLVKAPLRFYKTRLTSLEYANQVKAWPQIMIPTPTPLP